MTNRQHWLAAIVLLAIVFATCGRASAQDRYAGAWKIASSESAPWPHKAEWEVPREIKQLVGATVVFKADRIVGPVPLACKDPHYKIEQYGADMLFQGSLEENGDPKTTPDKAATALGFAKRPIPSITTGCESELEFHIIDDDHMLFGLNNRVYRMARVMPSTKADAPIKSKP